MPSSASAQTVSDPITVLIVVPALDGGAADAGAVELVRILENAGHHAIVASRAGRLAADVTSAGAEFIALDTGTNNPITILRNAATLSRLARDRNITVANLVDELVRRKGDCEVADGVEGVFRLRDLHREIVTIDAFLRRSVGLRPGQAVAIYRSNNRECFHWFLAVIRAGGVAVPLNPLLSLAEVKRILADSGTDILVTDRAVFERNIHDRAALNVRTWIQSDRSEPTMAGFLRVGEAGEPFPDALTG